MTPHQGNYYQGKDPKNLSPHDAGQPKPVYFLALPPQTKLRFIVTHVPALMPADLRGCDSRQTLDAAFQRAFDWLGFGAKTAVGYGAMVKDGKAAEELQRKADALQAQRQDALDTARRQVALASLSPTDRTIHELLDARVDKNQSELAALMSALKGERHSSQVRTAMARQVQAALRQAGRWRERSEKKNPLKDHDHQDTLLVIKWLAGS